MTTDDRGRRGCPPSTRARAAVTLAAGSALLLGACGGGGSDGDGGTVQLRGTVADNRELASRELEIRAASGELRRVAIGTDGRFEARDLPGEGPYLLRADLGDDDAWYALARIDADGPSTTNVHAYSDLALRNFLTLQGQSADALFDAPGTAADDRLPDPDAVGAVARALQEILAPSLEAYGLEGTDLASVSFAAGDQGVAEFLAQTPAIVDDERFTILATDPETDTRTTIADAVALTTDLLAADTAPPEAPRSLRTLPAASNEIVLVWEPASDDVAVVRYEVRRGGETIATTPFPVYADMPLAGGVDYTYEVIAIDAAGNRSEATPPGTARPLDAPDTTPPPAPMDLGVSVTNASARLTWTQADIADVAAFRVSRSVGDGMLASLARSTATALTDLDLSAATEYCYRVAAVDASENASSDSAEVCATTRGTGLASAPTTPDEPAGPSAPAGTLEAEALLAIDVSALACTSELESSTVSSALTLDAACYRLPGGLTVAENGRLTIAAGTVLKFGAGQGLEVDQGASLTARGSAAEPIVFAGLESTPGFWDGVLFAFSNSNANVLEHVLITDGGAADGAALATRAFQSRPTRLSVRALALRGSAGAGFQLGPNIIVDAFDDVVSSGNGRSGTSDAEVAGAIGPAIRLSGNAVDALGLSGGLIDRPTVWPAIDVPWNVPDLTVDAPLEIPAGAELRFPAAGELEVREDGSLRAVGTAAAPILFTGRDATPGFWAGVRFAFSNSSNNRLEHVTVEYAGSDASNGGGVVARSFASRPSLIALRDVTLRSNRGPGFRFPQGTRLDAFERITSTVNDLPGVLHPDALPSFGEGLVLDGNADDTLRLLDAVIDRAVTWPALGVPYRLDTLTLDAALTLSPATTLLFEAGGEITVRDDGALNAVGTPAAPIRLVGTEPVPGHWVGVSYDFSNSTLNRLENVELRHAGQGVSETRGNLTLQCFASRPSRVSVVDSTITDGAGWGVYRAMAGCDVAIDGGTTLEGNASGTINPLAP